MRVLLVDDHAVIRNALRSLLSQEPDMEIVGEAGDGSAAVEKTLELRPDVVVMDIRMRPMDGTEATRIIHAECPDVRVIGLSMYRSAELVQPFLDAGAAGFVTKSEPPEVLLAAIRDCGTA